MTRRFKPRGCGTVRTYSPRYERLMALLHSAKDAGEQHVVDAMRRLVRAHHLGWNKHARKEDVDTMRRYVEVLDQ